MGHPCPRECAFSSSLIATQQHAACKGCGMACDMGWWHLSLLHSALVHFIGLNHPLSDPTASHWIPSRLNPFQLTACRWVQDCMLDLSGSDLQVASFAVKARSLARVLSVAPAFFLHQGEECGHSGQVSYSRYYP